MKLQYQNIIIRNATIDDATILYHWWNDGRVMAHAGFYDGLKISLDDVIEQLKTENDPKEKCRFIIEIDQQKIGEMIYFHRSANLAEIGIKICELTYQNKGYGKILLSMLISELFKYNYKQIKITTNINNKRARHVYESLGAKLHQIEKDAYKDSRGQLQTAYDYRLNKDDFQCFN